MTLPVVLRPEATRDLQDARDWYERQQAGLGAVFATRAAQALDGIGRFPELNAVIWQDVRAARVRRHPYIIYYRILTDRVEAFAVLHASRDPIVWQVRA
ncbi:MAG: type II toxin-antitoxin system RelE/ParE family toxin [Gemmataceae bacterium]|nr:type II toxin-antitoxin system RelE/ParE family toxin [Gemmataceae bacterium]